MAAETRVNAVSHKARHLNIEHIGRRPRSCLANKRRRKSEGQGSETPLPDPDSVLPSRCAAAVGTDVRPPVRCAPDHASCCGRQLARQALASPRRKSSAKRRCAAALHGSGRSRTGVSKPHVAASHCAGSAVAGRGSRASASPSHSLAFRLRSEATADRPEKTPPPSRSLFENRDYGRRSKAGRAWPSSPEAEFLADSEHASGVAARRIMVGIMRSFTFRPPAPRVEAARSQPLGSKPRFTRAAFRRVARPEQNRFCPLAAPRHSPALPGDGVAGLPVPTLREVGTAAARIGRGAPHARRPSVRNFILRRAELAQDQVAAIHPAPKAVTKNVGAFLRASPGQENGEESLSGHGG